MCGNITHFHFVFLLGLTMTLSIRCQYVVNTLSIRCQYVVNTLSNIQTPVVIEEGLLRRGIDEMGNWHTDQSYVDTIEQMIDYCNTFHLIDKGNGVESRFVMAKGGSKSHG